MSNTDPIPSTSTTSPASLLSLLLSLPLTHPSVLPLLALQPLSQPSHLLASQLNKYLARINTAVLSRNEAERRTGCGVARELVMQDGEGWVLGGWGRAWAGSSLGVLVSPGTSPRDIPASLALLQATVLASPSYPTFEREAVHPIMGKMSVTLLKVIERLITDPERDYPVLLSTIESTQALVIHSPSPFRPTLPSLRPLLHSLILHLPTPSSPSGECPTEVRLAAANLVAALHLTSGKAQSSAAWGREMKEALAGYHFGVGAVLADGLEEDSGRGIVPASAAAMPPLPSEPAARLPAALAMVEGWVEIILALLRFPTARPVPVPIALVVSAGLRCLNLTLDTPTVAYISPQHHAAIVASLTRLWTAGSLLIGAITSACGDHLFPHLSEVFDHTVYLLERAPQSMTDVQLQLFRLHRLLISLYPPALLPAEARGSGVNGSAGKRGKKRARGAEDGLVASLEGRSGRTIGSEGEVILEALQLIPLLHPTPLLSPSLLTFSVRLHLSLHLSLPGLAAQFARPEMCERVRAGVREVLEQAVLMSEEGGTARGFKSVILGVLNDPSDRVNLVLHPSSPPLPRPAPPLSALHYFAPESAEEKRLRLELGFETSLDADFIAAATSSIPAEEGPMDIDIEIDVRHRGHPESLLPGRTALREDEPRYPGAGQAVGITVPRARRLSRAEEAHVGASSGGLETRRRIITAPERVREEPIRLDTGNNSTTTSANASRRSSADGQGLSVVGVVPHLQPGEVMITPPQHSEVAGVGGAEGQKPFTSTIGKQAGERSSMENQEDGVKGSLDKGKGRATIDEEDEGIPELDSGSSDEGMDEDENEDEEE
ncbi:hypothetical protein EHS25_005444 [Saitozyma podzolica]|uniref:Pre-rRNA-processing protein RIX1 n=1 Tax=Saitozyma podzolica TaxID=1890683 RepID=A0A427XYA0_9TREE|nr:hypothetical protein EHS25_005444 [Saitozyma podzolica]